MKWWREWYLFTFSYFSLFDFYFLFEPSYFLPETGDLLVTPILFLCVGIFIIPLLVFFQLCGGIEGKTANFLYMWSCFFSFLGIFFFLPFFIVKDIYNGIPITWFDWCSFIFAELIYLIALYLACKKLKKNNFLFWNRNFLLPFWTNKKNGK